MMIRGAYQSQSWHNFHLFLQLRAFLLPRSVHTLCYIPEPLTRQDMSSKHTSHTKSADHQSELNFALIVWSTEDIDIDITDHNSHLGIMLNLNTDQNQSDGVGPCPNPASAHQAHDSSSVSCSGSTCCLLSNSVLLDPSLNQIASNSSNVKLMSQFCGPAPVPQGVAPLSCLLVCLPVDLTQLPLHQLMADPAHTHQAPA